MAFIRDATHDILGTANLNTHTLVANLLVTSNVSLTNTITANSVVVPSNLTVTGGGAIVRDHLQLRSTPNNLTGLYSKNQVLHYNGKVLPDKYTGDGNIIINVEGNVTVTDSQPDGVQRVIRAFDTTSVVELEYGALDARDRESVIYGVPLGRIHTRVQGINTNAEFVIADARSAYFIEGNVATKFNRGTTTEDIVKVGTNYQLVDDSIAVLSEGDLYVDNNLTVTNVHNYNVWQGKVVTESTSPVVGWVMDDAGTQKPVTYNVDSGGVATFEVDGSTLITGYSPVVITTGTPPLDTQYAHHWFKDPTNGIMPVLYDGTVPGSATGSGNVYEPVHFSGGVNRFAVTLDGHRTFVFRKSFVTDGLSNTYKYGSTNGSPTALVHGVGWSEVWTFAYERRALQTYVFGDYEYDDVGGVFRVYNENVLIHTVSTPTSITAKPISVGPTDIVFRADSANILRVGDKISFPSIVAKRTQDPINPFKDKDFDVDYSVDDVFSVLTPNSVNYIDTSVTTVLINQVSTKSNELVNGDLVVDDDLVVYREGVDSLSGTYKVVKKRPMAVSSSYIVYGPNYLIY